ncbi:MAG: hypothetical protein Q4F95_04855 [Oscillospiraceae bacterium]|nr:hypothetical protein [Oscillospiraceae bacterium]
MKKRIVLIIKIFIVLVITCSVSSLIRVIAGISNGEHSKPDFVTPAFQSFAVISQLLLIVSYIILEKYMPVHNKILKGLVFISLFWSSDYISQIIGLTGASSSILSKEALSFSTILSDSAGYLICAVILGIFLSSDGLCVKRNCRPKKLITTSLISMAAFPGILFLLEFTAGSINSNYTSAAAFSIEQNEKVSFYIVFYLFQALSGFLFPVFYRYTAFNSNSTRKWRLFAAVYGLMLWSPVVFIVAFFGADIRVTAVYAAIMAAAICLDTYLFARVMDKK